MRAVEVLDPSPPPKELLSRRALVEKMGEPADVLPYLVSERGVNLGELLLAAHVADVPVQKLPGVLVL